MRGSGGVVVAEEYEFNLPILLGITLEEFWGLTVGELKERLKNTAESMEKMALELEVGEDTVVIAKGVSEETALKAMRAADREWNNFKNKNRS